MKSLDDLLQSCPIPVQLVLSAIIHAQDRFGLLPTKFGAADVPAAVVIGLSGGADSVCLLHALSLLAPHWNLALHAAHVDHGLRSESAADADFAKRFAGELGIRFHIRRLDASALRADERGVEAAARQARYAYLAELARDLVSDEGATHTGGVLSLPTVAVGHHQDDQAETVLMNFVRGSGLRGLSGMAHVRMLGGASEARYDGYAHQGAVRPRPVRLVRPLLGLRRDHLLEYNQAFGLLHREDATNRDTANMRNHVRHLVLPALAELNPQIVDALARTSELLRPEAERAEALDAEALQLIIVDAAAPARIVLDLSKFHLLSTAAQYGSLRLLCEQMGVDARDAGFHAIDELLERIRNRVAAGGPYSFAGNLHWSILADDDASRLLLSVHRPGVLPLRPNQPFLAELLPGVTLPVRLQPGRNPASHEWSLYCELLPRDALAPGWQRDSNRWQAFLDADQITTPILTAPARGLRFAPLGMSGQHKSLGDYFTDRKTAVALRERWPIIVDAANESVLWVCGHTISHNVRITDATRRVLRLGWALCPEPEKPRTSTADVVGWASEDAPCEQM